MPEIFISYARSTGAQAHRIEEALRALGYDVWRDDELPAHRAYAEVIEERLRLADAVLVLWSADAARSQWVRSEANRAREDGKLVQLTLDNTRLPLPFDQIHCADFSSWSGEPDAHEWRLVLSSIEQLTDGKSQDAPSAAEAPAHLPSHVHGAGPPEPGLGPPLPLPAKPSIAVLPFKDLSSVRRQEYLADALTEDTTTALSRWRWFFVISSHTSLRYKDREVDVRSIGNELGVRYVLEGSVRKAGKRLRVSVQLSETASGSNVWAEQFDRDVADILALQDEITEQIVTAIEPAMLRSEGINIARKSVTDFSALDFFYRGMWHLNRMSEESPTERRNPCSAARSAAIPSCHSVTSDWRARCSGARSTAPRRSRSPCSSRLAPRRRRLSVWIPVTRAATTPAPGLRSTWGTTARPWTRRAARSPSIRTSRSPRCGSGRC